MFIFLFVKIEYKEIRKGMDFGVDDYFIKFYEEEELMSVIESRLVKVELFLKVVNN